VSATESERFLRSLKAEIAYVDESLRRKTEDIANLYARRTELAALIAAKEVAE